MRILVIDDNADVRATMVDEVCDVVPNAVITSADRFISIDPDVLIVDVSAIGSIHDPIRTVAPLTAWLQSRPHCHCIIASGLPHETLQGVADEVNKYVDNRIDVCMFGRNVCKRLQAILKTKDGE